MTLVSRCRRLYLFPLALFVVLLLPGVGSAATTNSVQLDNGTCGQNLQLGSVKTASSSATPTFLLFGDGGAPSYQAAIDGNSIGIFNGTPNGNVCILDSTHLGDGSHTLTLKELAPNPANTIAPFAFTVDTTPPAVPSTPVLASYSDTGIAGDNVTSLTAPTVTGSSDPSVSVSVTSSGLLVGGALASSSGTWSVKTNINIPGTYTLTARATDEAGNTSTSSGPIQITIDTTPPTLTITNPTAGATVSGTTNLAATAVDNTAVWKVAFQLDGTTLSTDTTSPYGYSWNSATVADGSHTLTTTATDTAGNTTSTSETITVHNSGGTTTAPTAPTLNSAAAGNNSIALAWSAPSSNGGSAITGYKVYRGTSSGSETLLTTLGNVTAWTDTSAANGTTYYYKVSAVNAVGESVASNELSAKPAASPTAPSAPTLNSATPGGGSVALAWSAPSSNGGSAITGYRIYRGTTSGGETLLTTLGTVTAWTDTSVTNGTTYFYKVSALNAIGESIASNELSAKPATVPGAPVLANATAGSTSVALAWSAPSSNGGSAITGYRIYRGTTSGGETLLTTLGNVTTWTDTSVTSGTTYYYEVTAINSVGESPRSNQLSAQLSVSATAPSAPALSAATAGNGSVALAWSTPGSNGGSAITGYRIYRGTASGGETLLTTLGVVNSWTDSTVTNGTTYYYKVSALNAIGESVASNELSAKPATTPGAPTLTSATPGNASVALTWNAPSSNGGSAVTGYRIYRGTTSGGETLLTTLGAVTSWTDTSVTNATTYYYKVSALNSVGEGGTSNEFSARPSASASPPSAPTANTATAGKSSVALAWTAPSSNGGSAITGYKIYRGTTSGGETLLTTLGNVTAWTDTAVANGTTYYYKVSALNAVGESVASNELSATPASVPGAPTLTSLSNGISGASLSWSAPAANGGSAITGYRIYRGTASGGETLFATVGNVTSWTDANVNNGSTYYYKVSAINAIGEGARSNELSVKVTGNHK